MSRASRGERIIVTRYGAPRAMLCPVQPPPENEPSRRKTAALDRAFEREERAFDRMLQDGSLAQHRGR